MKNKKLAITIILLMALLSSVPFWLEAIHTSEDNNLLYGAIFYGLTGIALIFSFVFLGIEVKKLADKTWILLPVTLLISTVFLGRISGGAFMRTENKVIGAFTDPMMWLLIATLIGHLVLFIYKRNNRQII